MKEISIDFGKSDLITRFDVINEDRTLNINDVKCYVAHEPGIYFIPEEFRIGYINFTDKTMALDFREGYHTELKVPKNFDYWSSEFVLNCLDLELEPDEYGNYKWEKFQSPLKWYHETDMTPELARYLVQVDIEVCRVKDLNYTMLEQLGTDIKHTDEKEPWIRFINDNNCKLDTWLAITTFKRIEVS